MWQPQRAYNYPRHTKQVEQGIHKRVCAYLRKEYPGVMFRTDGGGLRLSKTQAIAYAQMQYSPGWPDLYIPVKKRGYGGLFIELKKEGTSIYMKNGERKGQLVSDPHIRQQAATLDYLNRQGYFARFAVGEDAARRIIDWYFERKDNGTLF